MAIDYELMAKTVEKELQKYVVKQKPMTKEEINEMFNNPMKREKREELYNAIFCYDENNKICGYSIQVRIEENDVYKLRFYLAIIDDSWKGIRKAEDLPDKKVKIGYFGEYESQKEIFKRNDVKLAAAMYLQLANTSGVIYLGDGCVGIDGLGTLHNVAPGLKFAGYNTNEATIEINKDKLFI